MEIRCGEMPQKAARLPYETKSWVPHKKWEKGRCPPVGSLPRGEKEKERLKNTTINCAQKKGGKRREKKKA